MKRIDLGEQKSLLLVAILLACFLGIDRVLVHAGAGSFERASAAFRGVETRLFRARSEAERLKRMQATLGEVPSDEGGFAGSSAITFLNGFLSRRHLLKVDLRSETSPSTGRGEPYQLTVQGGYGNCVLFVRDLEASSERIWLRDLRISRAFEGGGLEMRVRLEIEGPNS